MENQDNGDQQQGDNQSEYTQNSTLGDTTTQPVSNQATTQTQVNQTQPVNTSTIASNIQPPTKNKDTLAIVGLVFAFLFGPLGFILSLIALLRASKRGSNNTVAIIGIAISVIGVLILGILTALVISAYQGVQRKAQDTGKQANVRQLHGYLEAFYVKYHAYPTLIDLNKSEFRTEFLPGLDQSLYCDPSNTDVSDCKLTSQPKIGYIAYRTWQSDGKTPCQESPGSACAKYTITAILNGPNNENSTKYSKNSLN